MLMRQDSEKAAGSLLENTSADHVGFGWNHRACPGRFFAGKEMKILLAHLLIQYDFKSVPGDNLELLRHSFSQPTVQFADLAAQQRKDLEDGRLDEDISFWSSMHSKSSASAPLPLMQSLTSDAASSQEPKGAPAIWYQHEAIERVDPMVAFRIKDRSRKHKATPMQLYLAIYHVLLSCMTGSDDMAIGIADTHCSTMDELSAMGFFANLLPLRFGEFTSSDIFGEHLVFVKDSCNRRGRRLELHACQPFLGVVGCHQEAWSHDKGEGLSKYYIGRRCIASCSCDKGVVEVIKREMQKGKGTSLDDTADVGSAKTQKMNGED